MKVLFVALISVAIAKSNLAAIAPARSTNAIPGASQVLLRTVSSKFYQSLLISPVKGWITVRGTLAGNHLAGAEIIHSELDGRFDSLALELANNLQIQGYKPLGTLRQNPEVLLHVLVYRIRDGELAVSFAHLDEAGGSQIKYYGAAWMGVLKDNHLWVTIEPGWTPTAERRGRRTYTLTVLTPGPRIPLPRAVGRLLRRPF